MDRAYVAVHMEEDRAHWWFRGRRAVLVALLRRRLPAGRHRLLELGCGTGNMLEALAAFGETVGMEPDETLGADARRQAAARRQRPRSRAPGRARQRSAGAPIRPRGGRRAALAAAVRSLAGAGRGAMTAGGRGREWATVAAAWLVLALVAAVW